jgi:hypothetical protein
VFNAGVRCFGTRIGDPVLDQHLDGRPPGLDGGAEPPRLLHVSGHDVTTQDHLLGAGLLDGSDVEEPPELFLDAPGCGQLAVGSSLSNTASSLAFALGERVS